MLKKLSILLLTLFMVVPAMAQPEESCECMFAPRAGQWQVDLSLGKGQFFNDFNGLNYLLPSSYGQAVGFTAKGATTTAKDDAAYLSEDPATTAYNFGSLNTNNLTNIVGVQVHYFISNRFDINFMGAYNVNLQPSKNFIEGTNLGLTQLTEKDPAATDGWVGDISAQKAVLGEVTNAAFGQLGSNFYFKVRNPRINPYIGVFGQVKWGRVRASYPAYTGETVEVSAYDKDMYTADIAIFRPTGRAGQLLGFGGGFLGGVSYSLAPGLILGLEVNIAQYQYTLAHLQLDGQEAYYTSNHNVACLRYPTLKLGFRF